MINTYIFIVVHEDQSDWPVPSPTSSGGPQRTHICGPDLAAGTTNIGNIWLIIEFTKRFHNWKWSPTYWNFECMGQLQFSLPFLRLGLTIAKSPTHTWVVINFFYFHLHNWERNIWVNSRLDNTHSSITDLIGVKYDFLPLLESRYITFCHIRAMMTAIQCPPQLCANITNKGEQGC